MLGGVKLPLLGQGRGPRAESRGGVLGEGQPALLDQLRGLGSAVSEAPAAKRFSCIL